jgi:hypothetical protein
MSSRPMFHVKLAVSVRGFLHSVDRILALDLSVLDGGRRRPLLCRLGLHHWGPWDIRPGDWRIVERTCRRCRARGRMLYIKKTPALGPSEYALRPSTSEGGRNEVDRRRGYRRD